MGYPLEDMPDDGPDAPDALDADPLYRNYLETCPRPGVELVPRERVQNLIGEWAAAFERGAEPWH